jgi:hypothetical protein
VDKPAENFESRNKSVEIFYARLVGALAKKLVAEKRHRSGLLLFMYGTLDYVKGTRPVVPIYRVELRFLRSAKETP